MRVLALVESSDHVCCRYRLGAFEPGLERRGCDLTIEPLARTLWGRLRQAERCAGFDSVVIQRRLLPAWQVAAIRRRARHLVFDFDDAVLYRDSFDPRGPHCPRRLRRFRGVMKAADTVTAGNAFLADRAREAGAAREKIRIIPTCVDPGEYGPIAESRGTPPTLVWIGSSSTLQGLESSRSLWDRVGATFPEVRLRVICDRFPDLGRLRIDPVRWDEATEVAAIREGDIGIGWVPDDLWSRGKCGLKVLQYLAAGLPVVANPVGVHGEMVLDGATGYLATSDEEWIRAIGALLADPDHRRDLGRRGRRLVEERFAVGPWTDALHEAFRPAPAHIAKGPKSSRRTSRVLP